MKENSRQQLNTTDIGAKTPKSLPNSSFALISVHGQHEPIVFSLE